MTRRGLDSRLVALEQRFHQRMAAWIDAALSQLTDDELRAYISGYEAPEQGRLLTEVEQAAIEKFARLIQAAMNEQQGG